MRDHLRRRLDRARVAVHVEREQAAEAADSGTVSTFGMGLEPARELARPSRSGGERGPRASSARGGAARPGPARRRCPSGRGTRAGGSSSSVTRQTTAPSSTSRVPAEVLRRAVQHEVGAALERPQVDRRRGRRVDHDRRRMRGGGLEVGHREERVRRRLQPDELDAVGRRPGLVELHVLEAPARELAEERRRPVVAALGDRDVSPGFEQRRARPRRCTPSPTRRAAPRRRRARPSAPRRPLRSGGRSAGSRTRRARRPRTASVERSSGGTPTALTVRWLRPRPRRRLGRNRPKGKLERLEKLRDEALHAGSEKAVERQHEPRASCSRASGWRSCSIRARSSSSTATSATANPHFGMLERRPYGDAVVTGLRDDLRPQGLRLLAGLHGLRRQPLRGLRREDLQGDGPRGEVRLPGDRDQRLGRRADPGGRRLARRLRRDLLAERPVLRRDPADQPRHGPVARAAPSTRPR